MSSNRIKSNTLISDETTSKKGLEWVRKDHRAVSLQNVKITLQKSDVEQVVVIQDKGMKSPWILVSNSDMKTREIINCYAKRWKIEPYFRDLKDGRFGYGLRETHIKASERRGRLMLIVALYLLLVMHGQAGETLGFDKKLKVNTVKTRTHSLFRQGQYYYECYCQFKEEEQEALMQEFELLLDQSGFWCDFLTA